MQVARDQRVERRRAVHHARRRRVDEFLVPAHVRELVRDGGRDLVPHHHRVALGVRLRDDRQKLARARAREAESETQDALDAGTGHDRNIHRRLDRMALVHPATDAGVLALGVLPHDDPVEVLAPAVAQGALDTRQDARRTDVRVLVEALADLQAQAPQGDVIGDRRVAGGAEEDRVVRPQRLQAVGGHHRAVCPVMVAAPVEGPELEAKCRAGGGQRLEHFAPGRNDLLADAVSRDQGDALGLHGRHSARCGSGGERGDRRLDAAAAVRRCPAPAAPPRRRPGSRGSSPRSCRRDGRCETPGRRAGPGRRRPPPGSARARPCAAPPGRSRARSRSPSPRPSAPPSPG